MLNIERVLKINPKTKRLKKKREKVLKDLSQYHLFVMTRRLLMNNHVVVSGISNFGCKI